MKVSSKGACIQSICVGRDTAVMCLGFVNLVSFSDWKYHSFWTAEHLEIQAKWTCIFQILSEQTFWAEKEDTAGKSESWADVLPKYSEPNTLKMGKGL